MKFIFFSLVFIFFSGMGLYAQSIPEIVASNIANRMKDSLGLSIEQRAHIYSINLKIHEQKNKDRMNSAIIAMQKKMQRIENTRDSLYQPVLSEEQYLLYKQKKSNLISSN